MTVKVFAFVCAVVMAFTAGCTAEASMPTHGIRATPMPVDSPVTSVVHISERADGAPGTVVRLEYPITLMLVGSKPPAGLSWLTLCWDDEGTSDEECFVIFKGPGD